MSSKSNQAQGFPRMSWKSWFGYKVHLLADARYERSLGFRVTGASPGEAPVAHKLLDHRGNRYPKRMEGW